MPAPEHGNDLVHVVALLAAGVVTVPAFKRLGLGSVLGYLAAGVAIGPHGLRLFTDAQAILHVAELGVVMFLFIIGLEMQPSRLWSMRRDIFGLGIAQVATCALLLCAAALAAGLSSSIAIVVACGFVLSSTAIVAQLLEERGDASTPLGQRVLSTLLFEDLAIVPMLALVAFLSRTATSASGDSMLAIAKGVGIVVGLVVAGRFLLNPMFRVLAEAHAREVMTAAALLVVLGAAVAMQATGLSMAMGAFLAGVLLSESTFRHQLEADVEPFRGILLGLFFMGVGMAFDVPVLAREPLWVFGGVAVAMLGKSSGVYTVARLSGTGQLEALTRASLLAHGGEFAFVLYAAAALSGLFDPRLHAIANAVVIVSMVLTPLVAFAVRKLVAARARDSMDGVEHAQDLEGSVLIIGFGRFGQVTSQALLARGIDVAIIDTDTEMIRNAANFGFKVYYGDGTRLDVLHASGAKRARAIAVCVDNKSAANKIVELCKHELPHAKLLVRAFDRAHALELVAARVDFHIRETFESAVAFGHAALIELGVPVQEAEEITADLRRRDAARFELQVVGALSSGRDLMLGNMKPKPAPLTTPKQAAQPLSEETAAVTAQPQEE
jgi:glutathione-regulated potassium-efflux system protein KefB